VSLEVLWIVKKRNWKKGIGILLFISEVGRSRDRLRREILLSVLAIISNLETSELFREYNTTHWTILKMSFSLDRLCISLAPFVSREHKVMSL